MTIVRRDRLYSRAGNHATSRSLPLHRALDMSTRVNLRGRLFGWLALAALGSVRRATAQGAGAVSTLPAGVHLDGAIAYGRPYLSSASARPFAGIGRFGGGGGLGFGLGYDHAALGSSVGLELGATPLGGRDKGASLAFVAAGHWRPMVARAGWRPTLTVGYVRQGLGGVRLAPGEVPADAREKLMLPEQAVGTLGSVSLLGHGARLGAGIERSWRPGLVLHTGATVDAVRFSQVSYSAGDVPWRNAGWSMLPRLSAGLRWYPRQ